MGTGPVVPIGIFSLRSTQVDAEGLNIVQVVSYEGARPASDIEILSGPGQTGCDRPKFQIVPAKADAAQPKIDTVAKACGDLFFIVIGGALHQFFASMTDRHGQLAEASTVMFPQGRGGE
jgi:hypothetical protein